MAVPRKNQLLVRAAVMNCLPRCAESSAPLCCLGEFLEQLSQLGWQRDDIFAVERTVLEMLGRLKEQSLATTEQPLSRHPEGATKSASAANSA